MNLTEFLAMGGYGAFVWPCFMLTAVVLLLNIVTARRRHADARRQALRRLDSGSGRS